MRWDDARSTAPTVIMTVKPPSRSATGDQPIDATRSDSGAIVAAFLISACGLGSGEPDAAPDAAPDEHSRRSRPRSTVTAASNSDFDARADSDARAHGHGRPYANPLSHRRTPAQSRSSKLYEDALIAGDYTHGMVDARARRHHRLGHPGQVHAAKGRPS